jgi:predicted transcriptional regulator of viral defense system
MRFPRRIPGKGGLARLAIIVEDVILLPQTDIMNKRQWDTVLYGIAEDQAGYFTAAQARSAGLHQVRLVQLAQQGDIERVSRGVYRFARFPVSRHGHFMEAALWPQVRRPDVVGVISYESALAMYELSDVSPARVHVTLPTAVRIRRDVPKGLVIHYADLAPEDVERVEGVPVTTPERTIRDAHASHVGNDLIAQAIADGRRSGALSMAVANRLERELLGTKPKARPAGRKRLEAS